MTQADEGRSGWEPYSKDLRGRGRRGHGGDVVSSCCSSVRRRAESPRGARVLPVHYLDKPSRRKRGDVNPEGGPVLRAAKGPVPDVVL
jgi:hypothetical protein